MESTVNRMSRLAEAGIGLDYRWAAWQELAALGEWTDCWPEVDSRGRITGVVIGDEDGYANVDHEAMVYADDIAGDELWEAREDGYASLLSEVDEEPLHPQGLYIRALEAAGIGEMLGLEWSVEDHEGCDTAWMLRAVCSEQTGEERVPLGEAISLLRDGHSPRGATPYPCAAEALLAIRRASEND